ncbi:MAG: hypothetical protein E7330_02660 [Clostridiales bacterium]|nr:hypothetical protein [Clostridiales bacterium]
MSPHQTAPAAALRAIGMHPKYVGYGCSHEILKYTLSHPEAVYRLPQTVYPRIMELFGCSRAALDRNIRFAIARTWESGNRQLLGTLFSSAFHGDWVPTNTEFISVMTDYLLYGTDAAQADIYPAMRP